jgi:hypothetical protein
MTWEASYTDETRGLERGVLAFCCWYLLHLLFHRSSLVGYLLSFGFAEEQYGWDFVSSAT